MSHGLTLSSSAILALGVVMVICVWSEFWILVAEWGRLWHSVCLWIASWGVGGHASKEFRSVIYKAWKK